jgi:hypothetical protein
MIEGDDVPKICKGCSESYWEEMTTGYEAAYCGKYDLLCEDAIKKCERISCNVCKGCPRYFGGEE